MLRNLVQLPINEQHVLMSTKHPLIANMIESFQDETYMYLLLEFMPHGSLRELLKNRGTLKEEEARKYLWIFRFCDDLPPSCFGITAQKKNWSFRHKTIEHCYR